MRLCFDCILTVLRLHCDCMRNARIVCGCNAMCYVGSEVQGHLFRLLKLAVLRDELWLQRIPLYLVHIAA